MAESEIGALRVRLGFDAADFVKGAKQAEDTITQLAAKATNVGGLISTALTGGLAAIGAGFTLAGIKSAADALHDLGKTAADIGVTSTQLQELGHVARQAGLDHEAFNETLKTFKDRLKEAHDGSGELVDKLKENDAAFLTTLRGTTDVVAALKLLADHYNELTTEAKRSELANAAFGKDTEELTRLLDNGSAGITKMAAEAAGLGVVISAASVKTGTQFAEAIRQLTVAADESAEAFGVTLKNAVVLITPLLLGLVDTARVVIVSIQGISQAIKDAFSTTAAQQVASLTTKAADAANALSDAQERLAKQPGAVGLENIVKTRQGQLDAINAELATAKAELERTTTGAMGPQAAPEIKLPDIKETDEEKTKRLQAEAEAQRIMNQELDRYNQLRREGKKIIEDNATPEELMAARQEKLNRLLQQGAIDSETYGRAMQKATLVAVGAYASMASNIAGNLEKVFSNSKAVAIASALINTFEGATKALAAYPPPFNAVAAAAVVAAGLAQVANIRSTTKSGGGGGSSGSGSAASSNSGGGAGSIAQTLTVQGINDSDRYSGGQVRELATALLKYQSDGGQVLLK